MAARDSVTSYGGAPWRLTKMAAVLIVQKSKRLRARNRCKNNHKIGVNS
jgi:hypothetical protein